MILAAAFAADAILEFLGDAVLGLVVTDHLYGRYPGLPEGELAKAKATVVSSATLAEVGSDMGVGSALRLGKGEDASGGRRKASILSDAVEALIGALYLDAGLSAARKSCRLTWSVRHIFSKSSRMEACSR